MPILKLKTNLCQHCKNSLVAECVCVCVYTRICVCALHSAREQGIKFTGCKKVNGALQSVAQGEQH